MPTIPELKAQLRTYNLNVGGNKATLQARLDAHLAMIGDDSILSSVMAASPTKARSASMSSTSSVASDGRLDVGPAVLSRGGALASIMPRRDNVHEAVFSCLESLNALTDPKPSTFAEPDSIAKDLEPITIMVNLIVESSRNISLSSSHGVNFRDLSAAVKAEWTQSVKPDTYTFVKPEVAALLRSFLDDLAPATIANASDWQNLPFGYCDGTQEALENALIKTREKLRPLAAGDVDPDIPSDEVIIGAISATGISIPRLVTKKLGFTAVSQTFIETLVHHIIVHGLANFNYENARFTPAPSADEKKERIKMMCEIMPKDGSPLKVSEIEKAVGIDGEEQEDVDIQNEFFLDMEVRHILMHVEELEGEDEDEETRWVLHPSLLQDSSDVMMGPSNTNALVTAVSQINLGIQSFLRVWTEEFPEPTVKEWPGDFTDEEKKKIRAAIKVYVDDTERNLLPPTGTSTKDTDITKAVDAIVADANFPVALARTSKIVTTVLKQTIANLKAAQKNKEKREADAAAIASNQASVTAAGVAAGAAATAATAGLTGGGRGGRGGAGAGAGDKRKRLGEDDGENLEVEDEDMAMEDIVEGTEEQDEGVERTGGRAGRKRRSAK